MSGNAIKRREALQASAYILPSLIILIGFSIVPIFFNIYYSFTKYNVLSDPVWIGIDNYVKMFRDKTVMSALKNTIKYVIITVPIQTGVALVLAALIAGLYRNKFGNFIKAALFIPVVASPATIGAVWCMLLSQAGPVNSFIKEIGMSVPSWFGSKTLTIWVVSFVIIWKNVGYYLVIFYAGIMDINKDLYEAARIDGAGPIQQFFYVTVPNLKSVLYLTITLGTMWAFQEFNLVKIITNGGPGNSTISMVITVYRAAFKESRMGYASAISMLLLVCILLVSILQKRIMRGNGGED